MSKIIAIGNHPKFQSRSDRSWAKFMADWVAVVTAPVPPEVEPMRHNLYVISRTELGDNNDKD